ncbi:hypothetical protein [Thermomonospora umbrina]|uniref:Uncharacterized protein n=1 Tax=Thermomonospora umbrina TaxID=111806 RepID=A0A3D9SSI1_9ACTN|nr:hypothetical protein [Thermomonospora umbrina]REE97430.1 hypothetical protein DFJ69_2902 [Thermomonospora umbrina]
MTTASAHLSFEQLIVHAQRSDGARAADAHLQECPQCRGELEQWRSLAQAVRRAEPDVEPPPEVLAGVLDTIDAPRPTARRGRRAMTLVAAAGVIAVAGYGLWPQGDSAVPPRATGTFDARQVASMGLVSTECKDLKVAAGRLRSMNGSDLVVITAEGKHVRVDASGPPRVTRQVAGSVSDLTDGVNVMVRGRGDRAGKAVTATSVLVSPVTIKPPEMPAGMEPDITSLMAARGTAMGTVSGVGPDGFTVTGGEGTRVRVDTSGETTVIEQERARVDQLEAGRYTVVVGTLRSDGTLKATTVQQNTLTDGAKPSLPEGFEPPVGFGSGGPKDLPGAPKPPSGLGGLGDRIPKDLFAGLGCDSDSIATTALNSAAL